MGNGVQWKGDVINRYLKVVNLGAAKGARHGRIGKDHATRAG
jgi:hypothetical protein